MYVATYKIKSSGKIQRKIHIGNHEESMRNGGNPYSELISYIKDNSWKRFKVRDKKILIVKKDNGNILHMESFAKGMFIRDDIFYNKPRQIFCIGNDINTARSMKEYTLRYGRIKCQLKKK